MNKTLIIDALQHLDTLSVEELTAVKARIDMLIDIKLTYQNINIPFQIESNSKSQPENNNSLEKIIELVNEWMKDESDYDQETYSQIEAALNKNNLSI